MLYIKPPHPNFATSGFDSLDHTVVELDTEEIDRHLESLVHRYVQHEIFDKVERFQRALDQISRGDPIEMPLMLAMQSDSAEDFLRSVQVCDGRHHLYQLARCKIRRVEVIVPRKRAEHFVREFGYESE